MTKEERQTKFEIIWADNHSVPVESMAKYRFDDRDSYRMPDMASHYRTFCAALEAFESELPMIRITECAFNGYNLDGSPPIHVEHGADGFARIKAIDLRSWTCYGPRPFRGDDPVEPSIELLPRPDSIN